MERKYREAAHSSALLQHIATTWDSISDHVHFRYWKIKIISAKIVHCSLLSYKIFLTLGGALPWIILFTVRCLESDDFLRWIKWTLGFLVTKAKGIPSVKMVYQRIRDWTSRRRLPIWNFVEYPFPGSGTNGLWKKHSKKCIEKNTTHYITFTALCE